MNLSKTYNKNNYFFLSEMLLIFFINLFTILKKPEIVSIFFYLSFIVVLLHLFLLLQNIKISYTEIIILFLLISSTILFVFIKSQTYSFNYYKKMIMFLCTILYFFIIIKSPINNKIVNTILIINILISILYPLAFFTGYNSVLAGGITLNFSNPNLTAMWLLHAILYNIQALHFFEKKVIKILNIILIANLTYLLILTKSRACLIALFIYILLTLFKKINFNILVQNKIVTFLIISFPLIFAIIYMFTINSDFIINTFSFLVSEEKSLTSRYFIWEKTFQSIQNNFIMGNYYGISGGTGASQMHNTHLDVLASYGILVFILFIIYINKVVNIINKNINSKYQINAILAFYTIIIMGTFEAALVSGGLGLYILSGGFLLLAKYDYKNQNIK